ncbi:MAG: fatty acyl-AMP ligase, partial [Deltaproteobacteria bacterium]|nr:fatty acyl-AMP ligase [Deltaproteobacteria bacterium]
ILLAGAVPVPAYPPVRLGRMEEYLQTLRSLAVNAGATLLVTDDLVKPVIRPVEDLGARALPFLLPKEVAPGGRAPDVSFGPEQLALLQYTSGSTGNQKGVMLSHGNLLANLRAIGGGIDMREDDVAVSWLPLYHDMGLIGLMLGSFYWGIPLVAMSPVDFLRKPVRWLRALSEHRATLTAGPNFAYSLTARKVRDADLAGIDLSSVRVALCGAEPIYPSTIEGFSSRYAAYGLRPDAFFPAYGLAENSLAVSFSDLGAPPHVEYVDARALEEQGQAKRVAPGDGARAVVSCGKPIPTVEVAIEGDDGKPLGEGLRGEVLVRGPSVMAGYFENAEASARTLRGGWLHTGDLGFLLEGRLYISGRSKDLVIKAGRNYFAEDLEAAASRVPGVRPGGLCVFAADDRGKGVEEVVLVAEAAEGAAQPEGLADDLRKAVSESTGCRPDRVILVPHHTLPKTSSGKIQRFKARQWYLEGTLEARGGERQTSGLWFYVKAKLKDLFSFKR